MQLKSMTIIDVLPPVDSDLFFPSFKCEQTDSDFSICFIYFRSELLRATFTLQASVLSLDLLIRPDLCCVDGSCSCLYRTVSGVNPDPV